MLNWSCCCCWHCVIFLALILLSCCSSLARAVFGFVAMSSVVLFVFVFIFFRYFQYSDLLPPRTLCKAVGHVTHDLHATFCAALQLSQHILPWFLDCTAVWGQNDTFNSIFSLSLFFKFNLPTLFSVFGKIGQSHIYRRKTFEIEIGSCTGFYCIVSSTFIFTSLLCTSDDFLNFWICTTYSILHVIALTKHTYHKTLVEFLEYCIIFWSMNWYGPNKYWLALTS